MDHFDEGPGQQLKKLKRLEVLDSEEIPIAKFRLIGLEWRIHLNRV